MLLCIAEPNGPPSEAEVNSAVQAVLIAWICLDFTDDILSRLRDELTADVQLVGLIGAKEPPSSELSLVMVMIGLRRNISGFRL